MGEPDDDYTPAQRAAIEKLAVQKLELAPEQRAAFQKFMAEKLEEAAKLDKAGRAIDRAIAIRDGLIPLPWAEKPPKTGTLKHTRQGSQMPRLMSVLREEYPPDGMPAATVKTVAVIKRVGKIYEKRDRPLPSRDVFDRALKRGRYKSREA